MAGDDSVRVELRVRRIHFIQGLMWEMVASVPGYTPADPYCGGILASSLTTSPQKAKAMLLEELSKRVALLSKAIELAAAYDVAAVPIPEDQDSHYDPDCR